MKLILFSLLLLLSSLVWAQYFGGFSLNRTPQPMTAATAPQSGNLVGLWHLDSDWVGTPGPTLTASSGSAALVAVDPAVGTGQAAFSASATASTAVSGTYAFPNQIFTVAFWFKTTSISNFMVSNGGASSGWAIGLSSSTLQVFLKNCANGQIYRNSLKNTLADDKWHHVAVVIVTSTMVETGSDIQIYLDGTLNQGAIGFPGNGPYCDPTATYGLGFGARTLPSSGNLFYTGSLDEIAIWDTALTAENIRKLYYSQQKN